MINKLKIKLGLNDKVGIIGVVNYKDSQEYFYAILSKENNELNVIAFRKNIQTLEDLNSLDKNIPLIIALTGSGIVYSKDTTNLIFNTNADDYYVTKYTTNNYAVFTAFSRKDTVDKLISFFTENKFYILDVVIGVLSTNLLYKKIFHKETIQINDLILQYNESDCIDYTKTESNLQNTISVNNEYKNTLEIFLFSVGFNYFFPSNKIINQFSNSKIEENNIDYHYKKQFDLITKIGFLLFIISLILNFAFKAYASNRINKITNLVTNTTRYQNEFNYLNEEKNRKRAVIEMAGFLNPNFLSFYINEIGSMLPKEMVLNELNVLPVKNRSIIKDKQIEINDRKILISGSTISNASFNTFLEDLRTKNWIDKIEINNFEDAKKNKSNFKLEISLK